MTKNIFSVNSIKYIQASLSVLFGLYASYNVYIAIIANVINIQFIIRIYIIKF